MLGLGPVRRDLAGRPVLVFGSAPDPVLPPAEAIRESRLICANGSAGTAAKLGLPQPCVLVVSDVVFLARRPTNVEATNVLRGIRTEHLVVVSNHLDRRKVAQAIAEIGLSAEQIHVFSRLFQQYLIASVTRDVRYFLRARTNEKRLSTGMFACAIAFHSGAASCTTSGISFTRSGHSYSRRGERRVHVAGDSWFVDRAQALGRDLTLLGSG